MSMRKTACCYACRRPGEVAGIVWGGSEYVEYCTNCMKKFADEQYVGMTVRHDDEDEYAIRLRTKYEPHHTIIFDDYSGDPIVMSVPDWDDGESDWDDGESDWDDGESDWGDEE